MWRLHLAVGLFLTPLWLGICWGAHPLITDDAGTMGQGNTQFEMNGECETLKDHAERERNINLGSSITYGVKDSVDITLSVPYLFTKTRQSGNVEKERGFGDIVAEFKWRWYEKDGLGLALKPGFVLPTGNDRRGLGAGNVGYQVFLIATKELKPMVFHANAGYLRNENTSGERGDLWHLSLAGEFPLSDHLTIVANAGTDKDADPARDRQQSFALGGIIWTLSNRCALDGGLKYGFTSGGHTWSILTGVTFQF